jgi:hypothetical protein
MKTLDQVEARTPLEAGQPGVSVSGGNYTISASGSYYLTHNLIFANSGASAINFGTMDVTLDLNGFGLKSTSTNASRNIIYVNAIAGQKATIRNGFITGSGTSSTGASGIVINGGTIGSVLVEDVHFYNLYNGINLNQSVGRNIVRNCSVESIGGYGIVADVVTGCTAVNVGIIAIEANSVSDCQVTLDASVSAAYGIYSLGAGSVVQNCHVVARSSGIIAKSVMNSYASSVSGTAITADVANNCTASRPSGTALDVTVANGCYALAGTNIINFKYNMP